jgi:ABC-type phosphate/phosphonate transport system substrate-binding protein
MIRSPTSPFRWLALVLLAVALDALLTGAPAAGEQTASVVRIGLTVDMFTEVSKKDAEIALTSWVKEIVRMARAPMEARAILFDGGDAVAAAVLRGELDVFGMSTLDYLRWKDRLRATPAFVGDMGHGTEDEHLILVRRDSRFEGLKDLAGKRLLTATGALGALSEMWLDTILRKQGLPARGQHFSEVRAVSRSSQLILPVFFRQADVALAPAAAFATMQELNPQLGRELVVLARSPRLLPALMLFSGAASEAKRTLVIDSVLRLTQSVTGKQVLLLFKISRVVPIEPSQINGVLNLLQEHGALHAAGHP